MQQDHRSACNPVLLLLTVPEQQRLELSCSDPSMPAPEQDLAGPPGNADMGPSGFELGFPQVTCHSGHTKQETGLATRRVRILTVSTSA